MRSIWTIGVTLAAMVLLIGVMPVHIVRAQDATEPPPPKTEIRTYDISDLVTLQPNFEDVPNLKGEKPKPDPKSMIFLRGNASAYEETMPRADRITAIMDMIKNLVSREEWVPVGLINYMDELNGVLYIKAPANDHQQIAKLLADMRTMRHRAITVQWLVFEISTAQLHDLKQRLADGGLLVSAKNAKALLDELETGKLKSTPVASARLVCMNRQRTWIMPMEKQSVPTDKDEEGETIFSEICHTGTFDVEPVLTGDNASIFCTTVVNIAAGPADEKGDPSDLRQYEFQSTVLIPNGGGVLMTAANHKTAQAGREVVLFLQAATSPGAGADARR